MKKSEKLKIGSLYQDHKFKKGYYVYVGSAMNSLDGRINRHLSDDKKMHWHIDYLLKSPNSSIRDILFNISEENIECELALEISKHGKAIARFGSSDCGCNSHLFYFERKRDALDIIKKAYDKLNIEYYDLKYFKKGLRRNRD